MILYSTWAGKEWKPKKEDGGGAEGEAGKDDVIAEFDDVLKNATEDELCDLAGLLCFYFLMLFCLTISILKILVLCVWFYSF